MLFDAELSKGFWAEAVMTAAYIINRLPCKSNNNKSPIELWANERPNLAAMKIFGCTAMVHVPKEKRKKLDAKSEKCIFIGYSADAKAYKLYNKTTRKVVVSRDVIFIEDERTEQVNKLSTNSINYVYLPTVEHTLTATNENEDNDNGTENRDDERNFESESESGNNISTTIIDVEASIVSNTDETAAANKIDVGASKSTSTLTIDEGASIASNSKSATTTAAEVNIEASTSNNLYEQSFSSVNDEFSDANTSAIETTNTHESSLVEISSESEDDILVFRSKRIADNIQQSKLDIASGRSSDPDTREEALARSDREQWKRAMISEYKSLGENETWSLVDLPEGKRPVDCRWIFKTKKNITTNAITYKARLVVRGFSQQKGIDYEETYSPVVKYTSVRFLIAIAAKMNLRIRQLDAVTAFLNGDLKEDICLCCSQKVLTTTRDAYANSKNQCMG